MFMRAAVASALATMSTLAHTGAPIAKDIVAAVPAALACNSSTFIRPTAEGPAANPSGTCK